MTEQEKTQKYLEDKFHKFNSLKSADKGSVLCRLIGKLDFYAVESPDSMPFTPLEILNLIYEEGENIAKKTISEADVNLTKEI